MPSNPLPQSVYTARTRRRDGDVRGHYFRDQTAIIHSMPFRRLKHKTQVFFAPGNDHVCTRIEHVLHVATIAATICKGLNGAGWDLDGELAYAVGLGHDLGHAPFGHVGEDALNKKLAGRRHFRHEMHSYRVAEHLAYLGKGLNLTYAVKDGIISHCGERFERSLKPAARENPLEDVTDRNCFPTTYEGCIVRLADKIAYLGRDIEDAIVARLIKKKDIPPDIAKELGTTNAEIIQTLVDDVIESTQDADSIRLSDSVYGLVNRLKKFNYSRIYYHDKMRATGDFCRKIVGALFDHLMELYGRLGRDYPKYQESRIKLDNSFGRRIEEMDAFYARRSETPETVVTDFIAGMTDRYALDCMKQITLPSPIDFK